mgnify:CR=1 FL=1
MNVPKAWMQILCLVMLFGQMQANIDSKEYFCGKKLVRTLTELCSIYNNPTFGKYSYGCRWDVAFLLIVCLSKYRYSASVLGEIYGLSRPRCVLREGTLILLFDKAIFVYLFTHEVSNREKFK